MSQEAIFRLMTLLLFLAVFSIGGYFRRKAEREGGPMRSSEGSQLVILLRLLGLVVVLPILAYLINPDWVAWARMTLPGWLRWIAAAVAAATIPVIYWIFTSIGNNITTTQSTRLDHKLVTHGPYRWVRHPLYTTGFVFAVALMLLTAMWWIAIAMVTPFLILLWRTSKEEARLIETFGDGYREYMKHTGRFLPKWESIRQITNKQEGEASL